MVWLILVVTLVVLCAWLYSCVVVGAKADRELRKISAKKFGLKIEE